MTDLLRGLRPYLVTLAVSLVAVTPTLEECGTQNRGGSGRSSSQTCAPQVAFWKPARGHVVDVKTCTTTFFGTTDERSYVKIKSSWPTNETVWVVDTQGGCNEGDDWDVYEPQGPARCG